MPCSARVNSESTRNVFQGGASAPVPRHVPRRIDYRKMRSRHPSTRFCMPGRTSNFQPGHFPLFNEVVTSKEWSTARVYAPRGSDTPLPMLAVCVLTRHIFSLGLMSGCAFYACMCFVRVLHCAQAQQLDREQQLLLDGILSPFPLKRGRYARRC